MNNQIVFIFNRSWEYVLILMKNYKISSNNYWIDRNQNIVNYYYLSIRYRDSDKIFIIYSS